MSKDADFENMKGPVSQDLPKFKTKVRKTYKLLLKTFKPVVNNKRSYGWEDCKKIETDRYCVFGEPSSLTVFQSSFLLCNV